MTFEEYEKFIKRYLEKQVAKNFKGNVPVRHAQKLVSAKGIQFNIDLCYTFRIGEIEYLTIVECKNWKTRVGRNIVMELKSKLDELNAHKGIIFSSNGFESGAVEYALNNGIGLLKVTDSGLVEPLSHFTGNFRPYIKLLGQFHENTNERTPDTCLGVITPAESLGMYFLRKFAVDIEDLLPPNELDLEKIKERGFGTFPQDWDDEYKLQETCGLDLVLENENLIRVLRLWNVLDLSA